MSQPKTPAPAHDDTLQFSQPLRDLTGATLGDFRVERLLGSGGMGQVYLARQESLDRPVALKVLRPDLLSNPTYLARFESEAWAAAKLNHANIVHIYTLGSIDGTRFIAMEYVQGTNLREYLNKRGVPELPLALSIMKQAGQGVGAAGELGLIHRDIKPENLLLTKKGQVKIADFGLCRSSGDERLHLTQPGVALGTPMYMSPEQVQGHPMDHRSDLYSLGVTFYHMLAGEPPFRAETPLALALKHVREAPVSLAVHQPNLPPDLVCLVMKLMEKDPAARYQSAAEMLRDLAKVRESLNTTSQTVPVAGVTSLVPPPPGALAPTAAATIAEPAAKPAASAPRLRIGAGLIAAVGLVALALGAGLGWMARAEDLLSPGAAAPQGPPGLWLTNWHEVPKQKTVEAQYRHAQSGVGESTREAAWLAVPGYFHNPDWSWRAYTQLARYYFRHNDDDRLEALADDLDRSTRDRDKVLAKAAHAGVLALRGDPQEVVDKVKGLLGTTLDPEVAELGLEVVSRARKAADLSPTDREGLNNVRSRLVNALKLEMVDKNFVKVE
jgi:serine/threonine-protein kinase